MQSSIIIEKKNKITTLCFNRPEQLNVFNDTMGRHFHEAIQLVEKDPETRVVVLTGSGKAFMAGGDIVYFNENINSMATMAPDVIQCVNECVLAIHRMKKICIACVHGVVAGVGIGFMLACDLVIAAQSTQFTLAYSRIGLPVDGGASYFLPRSVGSKQAMEWLLLADKFSANEARDKGLINFVVDDNELKNRCEALAVRISKGPQTAYQQLKQLLNQPSVNLEGQLENEKHAFTLAVQTNDFYEGIKAFLEKRTAHFDNNDS